MNLLPDARKSRTRGAKTDRTVLNRFKGAIPRTKAGHMKGRLSRDEKLHVLDPFSDSKATEDRLDRFQELFGFWRLRPALTYTSEEHFGCWFTRKKGMLYLEDVARHLLANRLYPALNPQWVAPRSGPITTFFCIDLDLKAYPDDLPAVRKVKVENFEERRRYVEETFRLMGINPSNPRQVLIQNTPSGGLHYYVFLDNVYHVGTVGDALAGMGLHHTPGKIEVYPKEHRCLRLPFGHVPGQRHDPSAWIQFIDDYANHKIRRFSLNDLIETHSERTAELRRKAQRRPKAVPVSAPTSTAPTKFPNAAIGVPKRLRAFIQAPLADQSSDTRYATLMREGIHSLQEVQELWQLGIRQYGSRHWALKQLAMHLVWFKRIDADKAASELTAWAMDPRHVSRTIERDLVTGRQETAKQIRDLCRWCELRNQGSGCTGKEAVRKYSREELTHLCAVLNAHPGPDRHAQAQFYLRFVWFAKRYGTPAEDRSGWEAAPAVRPIIRSWPGCSHMRYKLRLTAAEQAGVFRMVREKKQTPNGTGRARTYRLTVPVTHPDDWVICEGDALKWLETGIPVEPASEPETVEVVVESDQPSKEYADVHEPGTGAGRSGERDRASVGSDRARTDSRPVSAEGSREYLDQGPRERPSERNATSDLSGFADVRVEPAPEPAEEPCDELELTQAFFTDAHYTSKERSSNNPLHQGSHLSPESEWSSFIEELAISTSSQQPGTFQADVIALGTTQLHAAEDGQSDADYKRRRAEENASISNDLWSRQSTPSVIRSLLATDRMLLSIEQLQLVGWAIDNERRRRRGEQPKSPPPHLRKYLRGRW